jgi:DNA-binding CsgD family transcriptional regulator
VQPLESQSPSLALASLAELGVEAMSLLDFRRRALELVRSIVAFDAALFHALSPRVPLTTAALIGVNLEKLSKSQKQWDDWAVQLGPLREAANAGRVASLDQVFAPGSPRLVRETNRLHALFGMRSLCIAHLLVREEVGSAVVLLAKRPRAFDLGACTRLAALVPTLALADRLHEHLDRVPRAGVARSLSCVDERLSPRQRALVEHVAHGHSNEEIAQALSLSPNTVRNHLARIFTRLGAANRADLVRLAVLKPRANEP